MSFEWPKRDEDGRHVSAKKEGDVILDDKGRLFTIGQVGPEIIDYDPVELLEGSDLSECLETISTWPLMTLSDSIKRRNKLAKDILDRSKSKNKWHLPSETLPIAGKDGYNIEVRTKNGIHIAVFRYRCSIEQLSDTEFDSEDEILEWRYL